MSFIEVKDLVIEFTKIDETGKEVPGKVAVDGVSLDIEKGSFVAVVGMNGSGKSTLAKIFQNPDNQIVSSIVEDDVAFGPENLGVAPDEIRRRVDDALKRVGMYDLKDKGAHMLSGGQKQRIAIAGAVAMRPACIVFDEPTAMLDPKGRSSVMSIIRDLNAEGITCVLITHFMGEAEQADRILVMKGGKLIADRTPKELFSDVAFVESAGLELPPAIELRKKAGLPDDLGTAEEIANYISCN